MVWLRRFYFSSLLGRTFIKNRTLEKTKLHSSQVKRTPQESINEFIIRKLNVSGCTFQIHLCIPSCVMSSEFTREVVRKFLPAQFS